MRDLDEILKHYLIAILFTEDREDLELDDFGMSTVTQAKRDIVNFLNKANPLLEEWTDEEIGHDFWLTRQGHGAGFWDREKANANEISEIATSFRTMDFWVNDLGVAYLE